MQILQETYAIIDNIDDSFLKLNKFIRPKGFEFVKYSPEELEKEFYQIFNLPSEYKKSIMIQGEGWEISQEFYNASNGNTVINSDSFIKRGYVLLLKSTEQEIYEIKKTSQLKHRVKTLNKTRLFLKNFIPQLRLFKTEHIEELGIFVIDRNTHNILAANKSIHKRTINSDSLYQIFDREIPFLEKILDKKLEISPLCELAMKNYEQTYEVRDSKIKFTLLMVALESIFNLGSSQISHTVSRHLSIILSVNKEEFFLNFDKMKKLYNQRSKIVHGSENIKNLNISLDTLKGFTRKAIVSCNVLNMTKKELFRELNARGF